ncbi:MAG: hypothetical protein HYV27_05565 [Candidatus Hydrogenedentes bacterium]|nr:hypothetical protein [Candidatus Hydrogenedentota bacterium]
MEVYGGVLESQGDSGVCRAHFSLLSRPREASTSIDAFLEAKIGIVENFVSAKAALFNG